MAERSFKEEVKSLRLGEGETFRGEGILAITKALLESGVSYVGGYQGSPISHLMDVLADAEDILNDLGVHYESSASEATAAAMLAASVNYPLRGACAFKSPVGTNVASDALANLSSGGVMGGAMIIVGEDFGEGSSIMQERSHAFAMKSQLWLLDPRPNLPKIVECVHKGFELSEASNTPVMLEVRIRTCHVTGRFQTRDNVRPEFTRRDALQNPNRDVSRIVLPPASFQHEQEKLTKRWPAAVKYIRDNKLNEFFDGEMSDIGIVVLGGLYNSTMRALELNGLADAFGNAKMPVYVMNVAYPLIDEELLQFASGKRAILIVEEGAPEYVEQSIATLLRRSDMQTKLHGKDILPLGGEYTSQVLKQGIGKFVESYYPGAAASGAAGSGDNRVKAALSALDGNIHGRPPSFCTGCPERPIFTAMKMVERDLGPHHVACDIGCHLFSILPPFNIGATTMGYGLGGASFAAFNMRAEKEPTKRAIAVMGDGGFWHNGLVSSVGNAVFNKSDNVMIIVDNGYSAATGGQDILSSHHPNADRSTGNPIEAAVRGVGVKWARTLTRTYDLKRMIATLKEALTTDEKGPKVIIAQSECMLNKQRRVRPQMNAAIGKGERVVRERFGVDPDTCTGDHSCIRLSGCPSLTVAPNPNPLRREPVTKVINSCVGCGLCGEVSHAAILCPSFFKASIINNPTPADLRKQRWRERIIGWLQSRHERRRARLVTA